MSRVVIGNGTISNNTDDLSFGLVDGDNAALLQNVGNSGSPTTYCQILSTIEKPSLEHPYRCTVLQWNSSTPSQAFCGVVKDRDGVYIRANGLLQVDKDERIGYYLLHSIDLTTIPPLARRGIIRSHIFCVLLFKPVTNQSVEVFIKEYYELPGNNLLDSIAVVVVANVLMDTWTSIQSAKQKKLSWLLQRKSVQRSMP